MKAEKSVNYIVMNTKDVVQNFIKKTGFSSKVLFDEEIAPRTTFKIGGKAACFVEPEDSFQLQDIIALSKKYKLPYFVLGGMSNIVFPDDYFDGIVISTLGMKGMYSDVREDSEDVYICSGSGESMESLVNFCTENGFTGMERVAGLPGTVGGAVYMNARCFDKSISNLIVSAYVFDTETFDCEEVPFREEDWAYKVSPFQNKNKIILQAVFALKKADKAAGGEASCNGGDAKCAAGTSDKAEPSLKAECEFYIQERKKRGHFDYPSAGSVFKNNRSFGSPSGKIVDECGLRGYRTGNAQVAPFHGNFIINLGGATQKDVKKLVEYVVNTVRDKTGFTLEPEIIFL